MAALGQTISGVAHELNNPLATILSWAERLAEAPGRRQGAPRSRRHPRRSRARRAHRPQPADVRAQAPEHADDGGRQRGRARDARAARLRAAGHATSSDRRRSPPGAARKSLPTAIRSSRSMLNLHDQRRAGDARRARPRHARRSHVARHRPRLRRARGQRRWSGHCGGGAGEGLRSVLHDEGSRQGHRSRAERRLRDRAGARRPHLADVANRARARRSSSSCRSAARRCSRASRRRRRSRSRRSRDCGCWSWKTSPRWPPPCPKR